MLPLSTSHLKIYLHPERAVVLLQQGLFNRRVTEKHLILAESSDVEPRDILNALQTFLLTKAFLPAKTTFILSGGFVKYQVMEQDAHLDFEEQQALLRHRFNETFGIVSPDWELFVSISGFGKPQFACAVQSQVLETITTMAESLSLNLVSVQPALVAMSNYFRTNIPREAWFIAIEHDCMYLVKYLKGAPEVIRTAQLDRDWQFNIDAFLARESLFVEGNTLPICLFWPDNISSIHAIFKHKTLRLLSVTKMEGLRHQQDRQLVIGVCAI